MSKLGNYISVQNGYGFKSKDFIKNLSGMPVIKIGNVTGGSFIDLSSYDTISEEIARKVKSFQTKDNDILIAMTGANVGKVSRIAKGTQPCLINQRVGRFILKEDCPYSSDFIYYLVSSNKSFQYFSNTADGAAQPNISGKLIEDLGFPDISPKAANKAGKYLKVLDEKIQLNTQINQTLEQIAQALFKSWFVDFDPVRAKVQALSDGLSLEQAELAAMQAISGKTPEELTALSQTQPDRYAELAETAKAFPCEMVEVDGVEVPKGWELSTISDCYDVVMGQSPKGETYNENKQGMLFYQGRAEFGWRFPTPRLFTTDPKRIAEQNSILMSVRAPVGDINIALEKCCIGRGLAALQHKSKNLSFGLYQIQSIKPELDLFNGEGTVFGSINQANLKNIQIINPDEKFIQLFEKYLSSCDSKIMNNEIENNALKEIRDLLLPRLLSGEIQL